MTIDHRILIADDDAEIRFGAAELLERMGLEILLAASGDEALSIVRRQSVHLALLDMHMPGRTGLEVVGVMREETLAVPCILWSGAATEAVEQYALRSGALAFLRKPVAPDLLREEIRRALEMHWGEGAN